MEFHHPDRPRLPTGRPCWLAAPMVALPYPMFDPLPDGGWSISLMVWHCGRNAGRWAMMRAGDGAEIARFLVNWQHDPERTLVEHFGEQPPDGAQVAEASGRERLQSLADESDKTAGELGL